MMSSGTAQLRNQAERSSKCHRFITTSVFAIIAPALVAALTSVPVSAASCGAGPAGHYYAEAQSGSGATIGTGAWTRTWTRWSVANNGVNFSDEAVWVIDLYNPGNSLEVGLYSGSGANVPWTNGLLPYYTKNNDANPAVDEYDDAGHFLPTNTAIWLNATSAYGTSGAFAGVGSNYMYPGNYTVSYPRLNYSQGEVYNYTGVWMGGGSGENFTGYWENTSRNFYLLGYTSDCADSPYWITHNSSASWTNGGY